MRELTQREQLMEAILDNPNDIAPRCAYIDWLGDNQRTLQCSVCEGKGTLLGSAGDRSNPTCYLCHGEGRVSNDYDEFAVHMQYMINNPSTFRECQCSRIVSQRGWDRCIWCRMVNWTFPSFNGSASPYKIKRGFVEKVILATTDYDEYAGELFGTYPITDCVIFDIQPHPIAAGDPQGMSHDLYRKSAYKPREVNLPLRHVALTSLVEDSIFDRIWKFAYPSAFATATKDRIRFMKNAEALECLNKATVEEGQARGKCYRERLYADVVEVSEKS